MSTELAVRDEQDNERLMKYEQAVYDAQQEMRESFYHVGAALKKIRDDEPFKPAIGDEANGRTTFKSWEAYCRSPRRVYSSRQSNTLITASTQRKLLPRLADRRRKEPAQFWTVETCLQMARLEAKKDVTLAISRIRKAISKNEQFTTQLVKQIVDDILGITYEKKQKQAKKLAETQTLSESIGEMSETVRDWMDSLAKIEGSSWEEMDAESPGAVKGLTQVLSQFISFLEE